MASLLNVSIDEFGRNNCFQTKQFEKSYVDYNLELSTKILMKEAEEQGMTVKVLDEPNNVIKINEHLIVQATKTNKDTYANILMLENSRDYFSKLFDDFKTSLDMFKNKFTNKKIMTYTHGQPAVPSLFDIEFDKLHIQHPTTNSLIKSKSHFSLMF